MSSKSAILAALDSVAIAKHEMPKVAIAPRLDDLVGQFDASLKAVGGSLVKDNAIEALQQQVAALVAEGNQVISQVAEVSGNRETPEDPHALRDINYAVIQGELAVAENGSVWVTEQGAGIRIAPFICENLYLVVKADTIVANMHEALKLINLQDTGYGVFISGPSKTADIEQALVIGAHGACTLTVYLV
ncbi:LUD domain-containing protein [Shewanella avicenniae]|uniref:LUD domain-containing protein n=1 Tax=Shewanella avicenniae TaxID=2814294 RepID=A0ABX7QPK1_9GAMM|nr:LUD domain-containing protein [Shewanella avicenniae]QSX32805.1 LUD domain-containing protein [Shewanella avicenniae]